MLNLNEFFKECKENPISLTLQKSVKLGNGAYKIMCSTSSSNINTKNLKKALTKLFGNKIALVEGTVKQRGENLISMIVKATVRTKALKETLPENMKRVTANIVADVNDNSIWEIVSVNGEKRLVLKDEQDFDKIFAHNNRICTAAALDKGIDLQQGDYVAFYNKDTNSVCSGYLLIADDDSMVVIDRELEEHPVVEDEILEAADLTDLNRNPVDLQEELLEEVEEKEPEYDFDEEEEQAPVTASLTKSAASKILDYMKILFKDTEFYDELDRLVGVRSKEGEDGKYQSTLVEAGVLDGDFDDIKSKIKNFLINQSVDELREELADTDSEIEDIEEVKEESANADGDIDFATEEEMVEESDVNNADEKPAFVQDDCYQLGGEEDLPVEEIEVDMEEKPEIEQIAEEVEAPVEEEQPTDDELLDEEEIEVVSESELDEGDFEEVEVKDLSDEELVNQLQEALKEQPVEAAVKDMPADLVSAITKYLPMKEFTRLVYDRLHKDLNALEMGSNAISKDKKIKESDLDIDKKESKVMIIKYDYDRKWEWYGRTEEEKAEGLIINLPWSTWAYSKNNRGELDCAFDDGRYIRLSNSLRNVARLLNSPNTKYTVWTIDLSKADDTSAKREERRKAQEGILQRYAGAWGRDKSGYEVDRRKYKDMLKELKIAGNDYVDRIAKVSQDYFDTITKLAKQPQDSKFSYSYENEKAIEAMQAALKASTDKTSWNDNKKTNELIDAFQKRVDDLKKKLK